MLAKLLIQSEVEKEINTTMNSVPLEARIGEPDTPTSKEGLTYFLPAAAETPHIVSEREGILCEQVSE